MMAGTLQYQGPRSETGVKYKTNRFVVWGYFMEYNGILYDIMEYNYDLGGSIKTFQNLIFHKFRDSASIAAMVPPWDQWDHRETMARKLGRVTSTSVPKNDLFPIFKTHQSILALYILYRGKSWKLLIFGTFLMVCVLHFARDGMSFKNGPIFVLRKSPNFGRSPRIDRICQGFGNPSENQVELWNVSCFCLKAS